MFSQFFPDSPYFPIHKAFHPLSQLIKYDLCYLYVLVYTPSTRLTRDHTLKENCLSLSYQLSIASISLAKVGLHAHLLFPACGLSLYRTYTFCHNICEFLCANVPLYLENTVSYGSPNLSVLSPAIIPEPWEVSL